MLICTEHLQAGMVLSKDIELKSGSYLITRREISHGRLTDKVVESIRKFSGQILPFENRVEVEDDEQALECIKIELRKDLDRVVETVLSNKTYTNFLEDCTLQAKALRVMEVIFSNPDIIQQMYDAKYNIVKKARPEDLILEHSIRTALLAVALGLRLNSTILSLVFLGTAALLHDIDLLTESSAAQLENLDEMSQAEIEQFVEEHQQRAADFYKVRLTSINPHHKLEILRILTSHHRPDANEASQYSTLIFHFADLVDEMVSLLPNRVRYNFSSSQLSVIGTMYRNRCGLVAVLSGLVRLYRNSEESTWKIIAALINLFKMDALLAGDFDRKLREIIDWCPFDSAQVYPEMESNSLPRTLYCSKCADESFACEHLMFSRTAVQDEHGNVKDYCKCAVLGPRFQQLMEKARH